MKGLKIEAMVLHPSYIGDYLKMTLEIWIDNGIERERKKKENKGGRQNGSSREPRGRKTGVLHLEGSECQYVSSYKNKSNMSLISSQLL